MHTGASKRRTIKIVTIIAIVLSSLVIPLLVSSATTESKPQLAPWAFPGAFANYSGMEIFLKNITYGLEYSWKVLAVNSTKAEVFSVVKLQPDSGPPGISSHVSWYTATGSDEAPLSFFSNGTLLYSYDSTATIMGKTIPVTAYVYGPTGSLHTSLIMWKNKDFGLPVQFVLSFGKVMIIAAQLVKTNVPGLLGQESRLANSA